MLSWILVVSTNGRNAGCFNHSLVDSQLMVASTSVSTVPDRINHNYFNNPTIYDVVLSGQAVHAYKEARKLYRASVRWYRWAHSQHLKAAFRGQAALQKCRLALHIVLPPAHATVSPCWTSVADVLRQSLLSFRGRMGIALFFKWHGSPPCDLLFLVPLLYLQAVHALMWGSGILLCCRLALWTLPSLSISQGMWADFVCMDTLAMESSLWRSRNGHFDKCFCAEQKRCIFFFHCLRFYVCFLRKVFFHVFYLSFSVKTPVIWLYNYSAMPCHVRLAQQTSPFHLTL